MVKMGLTSAFVFIDMVIPFLTPDDFHPILMKPRNRHNIERALTTSSLVGIAKYFYSDEGEGHVNRQINKVR